MANFNGHAGWAPVSRTLSAHAAAAAAKLRNLAPYAAMELILPGGSLVAFLFWLYRRHKRAARVIALAGSRSNAAEVALVTHL